MEHEEAKAELQILNPIEVRVVGALIEKEHTTPDYYPMTLNALTNACNQKSNRDPVMALDDKIVLRALDSLREKGLGQLIQSVGSRSNKYGQRLTDLLKLEIPAIAVLCVLLLRGPQTIGEIRSRCLRIHEFASLDEVEQVLRDFADREQGPLVMKLPRQAGRKESRFAHLLAGEPEITPQEEDETSHPEQARIELMQENERIEELERTVQQLLQDVSDLQEEFAAFKRQFE